MSSFHFNSVFGRFLSMIKEFKVFKGNNTREMDQYVQELHHILDALYHKRIPNNSDYTMEDLTNLCKSLIAEQRNNMTSLDYQGSWSIAPDERLPPDVRVDFVFYPTYIVVAILTKVKLRFPYIGESIEGYDDALKKGMYFSTLRNLAGSFGDIYQLIESVQILCRGSVHKLLKHNKKYCEELAELIEAIKREINEKISKNETYGPYGENYRDGYVLLLQRLEDDIDPNSINKFNHQIIRYYKECDQRHSDELDNLKTNTSKIIDELQKMNVDKENMIKLLTQWLEFGADCIETSMAKTKSIIGLSRLINKIITIKQSNKADEDKIKDINNTIDASIESEDNEDFTLHMLNSQQLFEGLPKLEANSIDFLASAKYLYNTIHKNGLVDYSPYILQYCRALENEILQKLFHAYYKDFKNRIIDPKVFIDKDAEANTTKIFAGFLLQKTENKKELKKMLALGQMNHIMQLVNSKETLDKSPLLKDFKKFIHKYFESKILDKEYLSNINKIIFKLRNKAAHPNILDLDKAKICDNLVPNALKEFLKNYKKSN